MLDRPWLNPMGLRDEGPMFKSSNGKRLGKNLTS